MVEVICVLSLSSPGSLTFSVHPPCLVHEQSALGLTASNIEWYVTLPLPCSDFIYGKLQSAIKTDLQMAFEEVVRETIHSASTMSSMRMVITCTLPYTRLE